MTDVVKGNAATPPSRRASGWGLARSWSRRKVTIDASAYMIAVINTVTST
jgi:hypothetical protein